MGNSAIRAARPLTLHLASILRDELYNCKSIAFSKSFFAPHILDFVDDALELDIEYCKEIESLGSSHATDYTRQDIEYSRLILCKLANYFSRTILFDLNGSNLVNEFLSMMGDITSSVLLSDFEVPKKIENPQDWQNCCL